MVDLHPRASRRARLMVHGRRRILVDQDHRRISGDRAVPFLHSLWYHRLHADARRFAHDHRIHRDENAHERCGFAKDDTPFFHPLRADLCYGCPRRSAICRHFRRADPHSDGRRRRGARSRYAGDVVEHLLRTAAHSLAADSHRRLCTHVGG